MSTQSDDQQVIDCSAESYTVTNVASMRAVHADGSKSEVRPNRPMDLERGVSLRTRLFYPAGTPHTSPPSLAYELTQDGASHTGDGSMTPSCLVKAQFSEIVVILAGHELHFPVEFPQPTPTTPSTPQNSLVFDISQGLDFTMRLTPGLGSFPMGPGFQLTICQAPPT